MFGRKSLDQARLYVQNNPAKNLLILKDVRGRIAVCGPQTAQELKATGFQLIDSED
jgi:uroporphyrinogen-III synthase